MLPLVALGAVLTGNACESEEPEDPTANYEIDSRLIGTWTDTDPTSGVPAAEILNISDDPSDSDSTRLLWRRDLPFTDSTGEIELDDRTFTRRGTQVGLAGVYDAPAEATRPAAVLTLDGSDSSFLLQHAYLFEAQEAGDFQAAGGNALDLLQSETGRVRTEDDQRIFVDWTDGSEAWSGRVDASGILFLQSDTFRSGASGQTGLTNQSWVTTAGDRSLTFLGDDDGDGFGTMFDIQIQSDGALTIWRSRQTYSYAELRSGNLLVLALGDAWQGSYALSVDEQQLEITLDFPIVERRLELTAGGTTLRIGGPNGWTSWSRLSGASEGVEGEWSNGSTTTWTFTPTSYTRTVAGEVTEQGTLQVATDDPNWYGFFRTVVFYRN